MLVTIKNEGSKITQAVLTIIDRVVPCRTTSRLNYAELNYDTEKSKRKIFDDEILRIYCDSVSVPDPVSKPSDIELPDLLNGEAAELIHTLDEYSVDETGKVFLINFTYLLIHADVMFPHGEELKSGKVKGRKIYINGNLIGTYDQYPLLNSILYDVELPDGFAKQYSANVISNHMYSQVDQDTFPRRYLNQSLITARMGI